MVRDYHSWMGGVDIHDQLRLQRYSLQLQTWYKKYYRAIFMGLVDVAIVNAYIVFPEAQKRIDVRPTSHAGFLLELYAQLLAMKREVFVERSTASGVNSDEEDLAPFTRDHEPVECPDWQVVNGVASVVRGNVNKSDKAQLFLCNKVWKHYPGNSMTCFQIWHKWDNGAKRPRPRCGRDIQSRAAGTGGGKKRERREAGSEAGDGQERDSGEGDAPDDDGEDVNSDGDGVHSSGEDQQQDEE
ncbi:hypothetical protein L914_07803 [Phytophthora nicotianae]|uniref:PiggyBac transposable element-derived protein domain-containing protein n=1 Tax=Phytophthora nicotianae TaxID=4792 RepID=W2NFS1_PHYNI|nr:hypothetical protein L914_07803 [Phytophthora nicotianae]